eukprot:TRINITY_DN4181_c0_g1_i12.p1 TRINITY_DN4181_c0_g1~~TRINITY_DN4181_c0_g1_i12.p1  ORF type:complete len:607 (-),score=100.00 TRINITY_DN4181_c0_g1_i12:1405-3225(-)
MIEHLDIGRSGYFHVRKRCLTNDAIDKLFKALRAQAREPSRNLFRADRVVLGEARYSAICFSHDRDISFLAPGAGVVERVFGYVLIVEHGPHIALFKSGLDLPSAFKSAYLGKISNEEIDRAIARQDAIFEKLRLKNMSISPFALRSKSLESRDLENAVAASSASRFIPQGYSVRRPDGVYSATPSTGRISLRADRGGVEGAVAWATQISQLLQEEGGGVAGFIRNFARPIELTALPRGVRPTFLGIDTMGLADLLFADEDGIRLVRDGDDGPEILSQAEAQAVLEALEPAFPVFNRRRAHEVRAENSTASIAALRIGTTRIGLRGLDLPLTANVSVERRSLPLGEDPDIVSLSRYLDRENLFTILFSDLALAYIDGALFRDEALAGGGEALLGRLQVDPSLAHSTSEKGDFAEGQVQFSQGCVFRSVVDTIAHDDDVLLCDDLGDEWADFIGIRTQSSPPMISFYHAKHGNASLSASAFHESVGQAIKNLGRMSLPAEMLPTKLAGWGNRYRNDGVQTDIARMVRGGTPQQITAALDAARTAPDALQRVFIVTSSLSRTQVEGVLAAIVQGTAPSPHFVQLYWLLMSYFSACMEMGVRGYVVCRP